MVIFNEQEDADTVRILTDQIWGMPQSPGAQKVPNILREALEQGLLQIDPENTQTFIVFLDPESLCSTCGTFKELCPCKDPEDKQKNNPPNEGWEDTPGWDGEEVC